jgi:putative transposase
MRKIQFSKNHFYHIYNRGVEKRDIFGDDNDRWRFLQGLYLFNDIDSSSNILWQAKRDYGRTTFKTVKASLEKRERKPLIRLMADCLMPNHYHLLIEEIRDSGISRFMHKLGTGYTNYFNEKNKRVGSLFQGEFKAVMVDGQDQLEYLLAYINVINPGQLIEPSLKEDGARNINKIEKFAESYLWGTHQEYLGKRNSVIIDKGILGEIFPSPKKYRDFISAILEGKKFIEDDNLFLE